MLFSDIRPFVRYIAKTGFLLNNGFTVAYDYRLFLVTGGTGLFETPNGSYTLKKGTLVYYAPGIPYRIIGNDGMEFYTVNFDFTRTNALYTSVLIPEQVRLAKSEKILEKLNFEDMTAFNSFIFLDGMSRAELRLAEILEEYKTKRTLYSEICGELLCTLLFSIARFTVSTKKTYGVAESVIDFVKNNYSDHLLDNAYIASALHYHENYISSLVKKHTGMPLHKYILSTRLEKAVHFLAETNLSVSKIAESTGFVNPNHFSAVFTKEFGVSPIIYRVMLKR